MKNIITLLSVFFVLLSTTDYAQTISAKGNNSGGATVKNEKGFHVKWKTIPFDHQVFIANEGQFDGAIPGNEKVLYGAQLGNVWAYFTARGVVYSYMEIPKNGEGISGKDPDESTAPPVIHYVNADWENSDPFANIEPAGKLSYYYTYPKGMDATIKTSIFKKITYKNIYPGIDIEYIFPKEKQGLKYSIILHPGADISKLKLVYLNGKGLKLTKNGDVTFNSDAGEFTDHSPISYYRGEAGNISASYKIEGSSESFSINEGYDKSKTLIIDPWVTNPLFGPTYDRAYDLDYDYYGNVFAFGSFHPYQLEKFNSSGVPQWIYNAVTFNAYGSYGDVVCGRKAGEAYITEGYDGSGAKAIKLSPSGAVLATFPGTSALNEFWRAAYNPCFNNIVIGAGGTSAPNQACMLDTNLVTVTPVNVLSAGGGFHDMVLLSPDPSGVSCYMATSWTAPFDNMLVQVPLPTLAPTAYIVPDNFAFEEANVPWYVGTGNTVANGYDGMATSPDWLYMYNSVTLNRIVKNTGLLSASIPISNDVIHSGKTYWGGLAVDPCDDIYVGVHDSIKLYNSSMVLNSSITLNEMVYDLVLGQNNLIYAAGDSMVCAVDVPPLGSLISSTTGAPSSCSACNGTATVNINCGVPPFSFHWSNGCTNQTDTGMCAGLYSVIVTDGACPPRIDSATVIINGEAGYSATVVDTNPDCGFRKGNITAFPTGGNAPYTYSWSNGSTTQKDTGLIAGSYTCIISDNVGCRTFVSVTLVDPTAPTVTIAPSLDSICSGAGIAILASGAKTYTWLPASSGLSCYNCPNPTASPTATTTYTVIGTDSLGCTDNFTATIKVKASPNPTISGPDTACSGSNVTLIAGGGLTYVWSPGGQTTVSITIPATFTQTLTVAASNGACHSDTNFVLTVVPAPTASIFTTQDSVCPGAGDTLTLAGYTGLKYKWMPGSLTTQTIHITQHTTTTYTLYTTSGTCKDSNTITIPEIPAAKSQTQRIKC
jgi:hypothetical protein